MLFYCTLNLHTLGCMNEFIHCALPSIRLDNYCNNVGCKNWDFHGDEFSNRDLPACNAVKYCDVITTRRYTAWQGDLNIIGCLLVTPCGAVIVYPHVATRRDNSKHGDMNVIGWLPCDNYRLRNNAIFNRVSFFESASLCTCFERDGS